MQGARYSIPYFVNPKLNYVIEGPEKRFAPVTGFDLLSKTGNAYAARKNGVAPLLVDGDSFPWYIALNQCSLQSVHM